MSKGGYWFKHDINARDDDKIINLRIDLGAEGYGAYFMILELLASSPDCRLSANYKNIAYRIGTSEELAKKVVEDYKLFDFDDDRQFYSYRLRQQMDSMRATSEKRQEAGRTGGRASAQSRLKTSDEFHVPTEKEVSDYCDKMNISREMGQDWYDFNTIGGWEDDNGKPRIRYWRAALRRYVQKAEGRNA